MDVNESSLVPKWRRGGFSLLLAPHTGEPPNTGEAPNIGEASGTGAAPNTGEAAPTLFVINHVSRRFATTRRKAAAAPKPQPPRARLRLHVRRRGGGGGGGGGGVPFVACRAWAETPPPISAADHRFDELFFRGVNGREEMRPVTPRFRPLKDWFGGAQTESVHGVPTQLYEAACRLRSTTVFKANRYVTGASFEHYIAAREHLDNEVRSELLQLPVSYNDLMRSSGVRERGDPQTQGSWLKARVWMAERFPLNVGHMLLLLEVIATANKTARRVMAALEAWRQTEAFPMKVHAPLMLTVFAQLACSHYAPCTVADAPDGSFELPADYLQQGMEDILTEAVGVEGDSGAGAPTGARAAKAGAAGECEPDITY